MSSQELGGVVLMLGYAGLFVMAIRIFRLRRVVWALCLFVLFGLVIAFKSLGVITGGRRY